MNKKNNFIKSDPPIPHISWGRLWIKYIEQMYLEQGLDFSGNYPINNIKIRSLEIKDQNVLGEVKDIDNELYKINLRFNKISDFEKSQIMDLINLNPSLAYDISFGHLSESHVEKLIQQDFGIFLKNIDTVNMACSCKKKPLCQHLLAIYYVLEQEINKNPLLMFHLRGLSAEELIKNRNFITGSDFRKNIHNKFISVDENLVNLSKENTVISKIPDFSFPVTDFTSLISLLPANPLFFERRDSKSKLMDIYETVKNEFDSILIKENLYPLRNSELYLYYSGDNILKAFITPGNSFLFYLKSKGSRVRYSHTRLAVPVKQ